MNKITKNDFDILKINDKSLVTFTFYDVIYYAISPLIY